MASDAHGEERLKAAWVMKMKVEEGREGGRPGTKKRHGGLGNLAPTVRSYTLPRCTVTGI